MLCKICDSDRLEYICQLPLRIREREIATEVVKCLDCGSFSRTIDYSRKEIQAIFDSASYTREQYEEHYQASKGPFLCYLIRLLEDQIGLLSDKKKLLDIGCSYGHFLDLVRQRGVEVTGVELLDRLRERLAKEGKEVYKYIHQIPQGRLFDIITVLDTLNYFDDPLDCLKQLRSYLHPDGVLLLRVPNRTPFLNLFLKFKRKIDNTDFLDVKHNISFKGLEIITRRAGFETLKVVTAKTGNKPLVSPEGKKPGLLKVLYYYVSSAICALTGPGLGQYISPGIILFCRRKG